MPPLFALSGQAFGLAPHMIPVKWAPLVGATVIHKSTWERLPRGLRPQLMEAARAAGLDRMAERFPDDVARAFAFAQSLRSRMTIDVEPADEPAHVYRAGGGE